MKRLSFTALLLVLALLPIVLAACGKGGGGVLVEPQLRRAGSGQPVSAAS